MGEGECTYCGYGIDRMDTAARQPTLKGFGMEFNLVTGKSRQWYFYSGEKRWVDTDELCSQ